MRPSGDVKNKVSLLGGVVTSHEVKSGQWCGSGFHMRRAASHVPKQNGAVANFPQGKTYATRQMLIIKLFNTTTRTEYRRTEANHQGLYTKCHRLIVLQQHCRCNIIPLFSNNDEHHTALFIHCT